VTKSWQLLHAQAHASLRACWFRTWHLGLIWIQNHGSAIYGLRCQGRGMVLRLRVAAPTRYAPWEFRGRYRPPKTSRDYLETVCSKIRPGTLLPGWVVRSGKTRTQRARRTYESPSDWTSGETATICPQETFRRASRELTKAKEGFDPCTHEQARTTAASSMGRRARLRARIHTPIRVALPHGNRVNATVFQNAMAVSGKNTRGGTIGNR